MQINENTRIIDLKVADLMDLFKAWASAPSAHPKAIKEEDDKIGGYEVAEEVTGYARQTLYQLKSAGELPYISLRSGGFRFSKKMIRDWLMDHKKVSADELIERAELLQVKRYARRK